MDGSYTIYLIDCTNNGITGTFADITQYIGNGYVFTMKRTDTSSNTLTLVGTNGQTFDGNATVSVSGGNSITFLSWNTLWTSVY
jgi:hypothetical protein